MKNKKPITLNIRFEPTSPSMTSLPPFSLKERIEIQLALAGEDGLACKRIDIMSFWNGLPRGKGCYSENRFYLPEYHVIATWIEESDEADDHWIVRRSAKSYVAKVY